MATSTAPTSSLSSLYNQFNLDLSSEIESEPKNFHSSNNTVNTRNTSASYKSNSSRGIMSSFYFGSSTRNEIKSEKKVDNTKISVSILGDAFVDLFCYLNDGSQSQNGGTGERSLPKLGGDVRINQPVKPVAGGSGVNTATHLASLVEKFPFSQKNDDNDDNHGNNQESEPIEASARAEENKETEEDDLEQMDITLQTVVNENDDYGRLLISHAKANNFEIINCRRKVKAATPTTTVAASAAVGQQQQEESTSASTGHCIVLVTQNERSFITHLGIMQSFQPSHTILHELVQCRSANPSFINHHHHIHIAGYYNVPKFHSKNALKKRIKLIREKRRTQSHGKHVYTTTISLTPQYDATEKWSTVELFNLLPLVDFLILNLVEACKICRVATPEDGDEDGGNALNRSVLFLRLADILDEKSPQTYVIVTLGKGGAVLLYGGEVVYTHASPMRYDSPVDPTGAGDAFVSGFLFGTMNWRRKREHNQVHEIGSVLEEAGGWTEAIEDGMKWGCVTGTACVMKAGASVPSTKEEIEALLYPKLEEKSQDEEKVDEDEVENEKVEDVVDDNDDRVEYIEEEESEYDSEYDSEFDSDYIDDDDSQFSSSYSEVEYYYEEGLNDSEDETKERKRWV